MDQAVTGINSYSLLIRDAMLARLQELPYFAPFVKFGRARGQQVQPEDVPYLACYFLNEALSPDGDINHAEPRFYHNLNLGFSVIIRNNNIERAETVLDQAHWAIMWAILTDPKLRANNQFEIEGFSRATRTHHYGTIAGDNETPVAELRMELGCAYRSYWPPEVPDWLQLTHLETAFPDIPRRNEVQQVVRYWYQYNLKADDLVVGAPVLGTPSLS
jgi:hypothetical protein